MGANITSGKMSGKYAKLVKLSIVIFKKKIYYILRSSFKTRFAFSPWRSKYMYTGVKTYYFIYYILLSILNDEKFIYFYHRST